MYLPARVLLHFLRDSRVETVGNVFSQMLLSGARLLMREDKASDLGTIYICHLSELAFHEEITSNMLFACINDTENGEYSAPEGISVLIFLNTTLSELLFRIQSIMSSVERWNHAMIQCIIEKNLQKLLDCSKEIIGNSIVISDSNFSLLAHAVNFINDDEGLIRLVNTRVFAEETVHKFLEYNVPYECRQQQDIEIKTSHRYSKYILATYTVMAGDNYYLRVTMYCDLIGVDPGLLDLFSMLLEHIKIFVACVPDFSKTFKEKYSSFIIDMIDGRMTDPANVRTRARLCGIDIQAPVSVYKVIFNSMDGRTPAGFLIEKIRSIWPSAKVVPRDDEIIIVTSQTKKELEASGFYDAFKSLLKDYGALCGFSASCDGISQLGSAYNQADLALKYGVQIRDSGFALEFGLIDRDEFAGADLFSFETYYVYYMYDNSFRKNLELFGNTESVQILVDLRQNDKADGTRDLKLLHDYLAAGCRATYVSNTMHMHRNNVIYRISRIKKQYELDFSNHEQCFKLLLAYRFLEYCGDILPQTKRESA